MISAHWETDETCIGGHHAPPTIYDYSGFPPESYTIKHPAPGDPELARWLVEKLRAAGLVTHFDPDRGLDHGAFVPLRLLDPSASIPVIPVSIGRTLDPAEHLALGTALHAVRAKGGLIIGSGMSFHNLRTLIHGKPTDQHAVNKFSDWLSELLTDEEPDIHTRQNRWIQWADAPGARESHPREEHLIPFMVCHAAARFMPGTMIFDSQVMGQRSLAVRWDT